MKKTVRFCVLCFSSLLMLSGCGTVQDEIFLRNVQIEGSPSLPPVHITEGDVNLKSVRLSPQLAIGKGLVSTSLDKQYEGQIPAKLTDFQAKGLNWNLPRLAFGLDLDYTTSRTIALNAGISATIGKSRQFTAFYGGIGFISTNPSTSFRLDFGGQYIEIAYRSATVVLRTTTDSYSRTRDTLYFFDHGNDYHFNVFANLTLNSTRTDWPVNWFIHIGLSPQTLTEFTPSKNESGEPGPYIVSDQRAASSVIWLSANPGIYLTLADNRRLLFGIRLMTLLSPESSTPEFITLPMIQLDWTL